MMDPSHEPSDRRAESIGTSQAGPSSFRDARFRRLREVYRFDGLAELRDGARLMRGKVAMMDSDEVYALADGRQIHLDWIRVSRTFLGFMVGLPQACSTHIREELRQKAELRGWQVIDMHGEILPRFQCIASLTSYECVRTGDYSYLDVCWFVDSLDVS